MIKRLILKISFLICIFSLFLCGKSNAFYSNTQNSFDNNFTAQTLSFSVSGSSFNINQINPSFIEEKIFRIQKTGTADFNYKIKFSKTNGNDDFCSALQLTVKHDDEIKYSGNLSDFEINSFFINNREEEWIFSLAFNNSDPLFQNKTCDFDFLFNARQTDSDGSWGFTDSYNLQNHIYSNFWLAPTTNIIKDESTINFRDLAINYTVDYLENLDYVQLCYRHIFDTEFICPDNSDFKKNNNESFVFHADKDGLWSFYTQSVLKSGYQEDISEPKLSEKIYSVLIDTENPFTNLSLGQFDQNRFAFNEKMTNGNFEDTVDSSRGWLFEGIGDTQIAEDLGNKFALLQNNTSAIYQTVSLPNSPSTLSFWYQIFSQDIVDYDWFEAKIIDIDGTKPDEIITKIGSPVANENWSSGDWQEITHSLSNWLGRTVKVWFGLINHDDPDNPLETSVSVDNVRITNSPNFINSSKLISLNSSDSTSGTAQTFYKINDGEYQEYTDSFTLDIGATISYFSTDNADNIGDTQAISLEVDDTLQYFSVVLNQISPMPSSGDKWIELWNNSAQSIDINNWFLEDGLGNTLPVATTILANSSSIVYLDSEINFDLNQNGGAVKLFDNNQNLIDSYSYSSISAPDQTWKRIPNGVGIWTDPKSIQNFSSDINFDNNQVFLSLKNISLNAEFIDYEIKYFSNNIEKGISGKIDNIDVSRQIERQFFLGTCSGSVCKPDSLDVGSTLSVTLNFDNQNIIKTLNF